MPVRRVCLVGAGFISGSHAEALTALPGVEVGAVIDPNQGAAQRLANTWKVGRVYTSVDDALAAGDIDCAHVVVPPPLHAPLGAQLLRAGMPVLMEKPLAVDAAGCRELVSAAAEGGAVLGINQNFVHHPAFARLRSLVDRRALGRLESVDCTYSVPLRQLATRQFGHWMFQQPRNILLEQAVHPFSQILSLTGPVRETRALAGAPIEISPGVPFYGTCSVSLEGERAPGALQFGVGRAFPHWQVTALCEDGVIVADMVANRMVTFERSPWLEAMDNFLSGNRIARQSAFQSGRNLLDYALSMVKIKSRADAFYLSMKDSIGAFHAALDDSRQPELDGAFGASLVSLCDDVADQVFTRPVAPPPEPQQTTDTYDVAVLGGTGFIGRSVVARCREASLSVGVMARNLRNLSPDFHQDGVTLIAGDVTRPDDVKRAIGNATHVVNLAHGGGGDSWAAIERSLVGSARIVAEACLEKGVTRLVHVGSIAGLYLGDPGETVTGATPPDPQPEKRGDYARAKAVADTMLLDIHRGRGLPVCILRPAVVIGDGTSPFHSGVGLYNNEQHCMGWSQGKNPLPFVLVDDVAQAVVAALKAEGIDGKAYNLVGDVRIPAREYTAILAESLGRPLKFHPQSIWRQQAVELGKWLIKQAGGRRVPVPSLRDLKSRGLAAQFDCSDVKQALNWQPVADMAAFRAQAIDIHRRADDRSAA